MKKILSIIAIAASALVGTHGAAGQESVTVVKVNLHDGTTEQYKLTESPEMKMENGKILVASTSMQGEYDLEAVSHLSFEKQEESAIDDVAADAPAAFEFTYVDNATVAVAAPALEWVAVYTLTGAEVMRVAAADHRATLTVSGLAPGVYVVAPSCHSAIKIVRK